jgi:hypothetical protein
MANLSLRLATKIGKQLNNTLPQVKYINLQFSLILPNGFVVNVTYDTARSAINYDS